MPQIIDDNEQDQRETIAAKIMQRRNQRDRLRSLLPNIASDVTAALAIACLPIPIFLAIPTSGDSLVTIVTPIDPSDADWNAASKIVCDIVEHVTGLENLIAREVACVSTGIPIGAADVRIDTDNLATQTPEPPMVHRSAHSAPTRSPP